MGGDWKQGGQKHFILVLSPRLVPPNSTTFVTDMCDNAFTKGIQDTVAFVHSDISTEPYQNMVGYGDLQILGVNTMTWPGFEGF